MRAEKLILETDQDGHLLQQPTLPPNTRLEAIFLILDDDKKKEKRRKPSSVIWGKGKIIGDIVSPITPPEDWEVME